MDETLKHVAIIMDGNGRWAKQRGKKRSFGHLQGVKNVRRIAMYASKLGISYLTLYAFSTENWKRPLEEVNYLMALPKLFFDSYLKELMQENIRIMMIGSWNKIPTEACEYFRSAIKKTAQNTGMTLCFALNYGSRQEIVQAAQRYAEDYCAKKVSTLNEELFADYLYTSGMPEVDLMIRTSGEKRISNFLLYQLAYSELVFTDCPWPDFMEAEFDRCLEEYQKRQRRFGGLDS